MIYIGIDPGVEGGIAGVSPEGDVRGAWKMPETERDLLDVLLLLSGPELAPGGGATAILERVNAGVFGHGKAGKMGVTSAFTFGKGYGRLLMALTAARIPFSEVSPITWQSAMQCRTGGIKNISKRRAQQLFPSVTCTHAISDALLIAEYCRQRASLDLGSPARASISKPRRRLHGVSNGDRQPASRTGNMGAQPNR